VVEYVVDQFEGEVRAALLATGLVPAELIEVAPPNPAIPADLTFPAFRLAREVGKQPAEVAREIAGAVRVVPGSLIGEVTAAGPYVNISVNAGVFAGAVLDEIERLGDRFGHDDVGAVCTVVIDYSSPNIAKRMHVGHIRSTVIGQAIVNILQALGYHTISDNHLGDWGKSFGVILLGVEQEGFPDSEGEALLTDLEALYARTSARVTADPGLDQAARDWSLRLEQGDPVARALWQQAVRLTVDANQPSYDRLRVRFDHAYGESFYEAMLAGVIDDALAAGVAYRDESGAVVADVGEGLPTFLLQRSDGGTLYHTRDAATIKFRVEAFHPDTILYVIGEPQSLYLRQLFALARALGYVGETELVHVAFGTVFDANGQPLSTRRGNMVYLQTLLEEGHDRARALVDQANPELSDGEKEAVAEAVGVGAVIYNELSQDPKRNITLDWDRMLSVDGNSAAYIQYMDTRGRSLLRRAADEGLYQASRSGAVSITHPAELELVKQLARMPVAVRDAGAEYAPSEIATWCYASARAFAAFYRDCPVLQAANGDTRNFRLRLTAATSQGLRNGLGLLGIAVPERM
jgi:arginyl-tRNA synthetase